MIVEKDISRVSIGSFIVKVIKQRSNDPIERLGWVEDLQTIEKLIDKGVERVLIDTKKIKEATPPKVQSAKIEPIPSLKLSNIRSFAELLYHATDVFEAAVECQQVVINRVQSRDLLCLESILKVIAQIVDEVFDDYSGLATVIYARNRNRYLCEHAASVAVLMAIFCRHLELDKALTQELVLGAFLHDTGKALIDQSILNKPSEVDKVEFEVIKSHVNHSINILKSTHGIPKLSVKLAAQHHERLDGSGYPKGFDERVISKYGRMIAICDVYDALTSDKVYRGKVNQVKAFSTLLEMSNKSLLDIILVNSFIKALGVFPLGSIVELSNSHLAIVEELNLEQPLMPVVRIFYDLRLTHFVNTKRVDLQVELSLKIKRAVNPNDHKLDFKRIVEFLTLDG